MLIPFTKLMVAAAPAASDVVVDAKATLPQGLWSNLPTPGRMDPAAAAECGAIRPLPPSPGGAGRVEGPLSATATLTTAAITTTAATIAADQAGMQPMFHVRGFRTLRIRARVGKQRRMQRITSRNQSRRR